MKDTYDCQVSVGPYTLDITFEYSGKVVTGDSGEQDIDGVDLENIRVETFKDDDWLFSDNFGSIDELNLPESQRELLEQAEERAFNIYVDSYQNWVSEAENYADCYEYSYDR